MYEKRGIKIYDFAVKEDRDQLEKVFYAVMQIEDLIPIIGSGFTKNIRTKNGNVPSAEELRKKIISIIHQMDDSDEEEFEKMKLFDFADFFWEEIEKSENQKYNSFFRDYVEENFTRVYDVEQSKRHFLNSGWKTIFTLNYDDTVESILSIETVIPYEKFNIRSGKSTLIKLHGDAKQFVKSGDSKYCVMGKQQYVSLIKSEKNADIVRALENTFFSKSVIFIGCSLDNELDLLYSAGVQLEEKAKLNAEHHVIYLLYDNDDHDVNVLSYKNYGITDIIKINESNFDEICEFIYNINNKLKKISEKDLLQEYTNISFESIDGRNDENIDYLFFNEKIKIQNGIIKYPAFFVERTDIKELQDNIVNDEGILHIVYGTKFSGKSYALLQLLRSLKNRQIYYFPSYITLSNEIIESLFEKNNTIFLIDEGAILFEQYRNIIVPKLNKLDDAHIRIVMTVSRGDADFYKYYKNLQNNDEEFVKLYELKNKFDKNEADKFNKGIGEVSLVPYKNGDTILDYLFKAEDNLLQKKQNMILPRVNFLSNSCEREVCALIILATKNAITSNQAIEFGIDDVLYNFINSFPSTVQKDYLSNLEKTQDTYSGFKFILNSSYWAIKCLSHFAYNPCNHKTVVQSYQNIVNAYSRLENYEMNNRIKPYYILDRIQYLFSDQEKRGTIKLPYMIYEGLHSSLNWNYQFLHQEAKCELRMAKREKNIKYKNQILEQAYRNISRAGELANASTSGNAEYTIAHMNVTKALILINYVLLGDITQLSKTIDECYEAFVVGESLCPQLQKEELKDVKTFLEKYQIQGIDLDRETENKFDELLTSFIRKPSWSKVDTRPRFFQENQND